MDEYIDRIDENRDAPPLNVLLPSEMMKIGLELVYTQKRIMRVEGDPYTSQTNVQRFKDHFGANPVVVSKIWEAYP